MYLFNYYVFNFKNFFYSFYKKQKLFMLFIFLFFSKFCLVDTIYNLYINQSEINFFIIDFLKIKNTLKAQNLLIIFNVLCVFHN